MLTAENRLSINDLYARFVDVVARQDSDGLRDLFQPDSIIEGPLDSARVGVDAIVSSMVSGFANWEILLLVPQSLLMKEAPHSKGPRRVNTRWYVSEVGRRNGDDVAYAGVYQDVLVQTGEFWRFERRQFDLLYAKAGSEPGAASLPDGLGPWR